jgi:hypothetical protein
MGVIMLERSSIVKQKKQRIFKRRLLATFPQLRPRLFRRRKRRNVDVTVCIAAMCERDIILGAADRMITSGDIEFEPSEQVPLAPVFKIAWIMNSIAAMTAGDSGFQSEAIAYVRSAIWKQINAKPAVWPNVRDAVDHYIRYYNWRKNRDAEQKFLLPFGLDRQSFLAKQKDMAPKVAAHLVAEMIGHDVEYEVETIFTGVDETGAHIYQLVENVDMCCDPVGFAAIGSGGRHAESQFMLARHSRNATFDETLFLLYSAKKQSEVAPGVGEATDLFAIGPQKGSFVWLGGTAWPFPGIIDMGGLDEIYQSAKQKREKIVKDAKKEIKGYVDTLRDRAEKSAAKQPAEKTDARVEVTGVSANATVGDASVMVVEPKPKPAKAPKGRKK